MHRETNKAKWRLEDPAGKYEAVHSRSLSVIYMLEKQCSNKTREGNRVGEQHHKGPKSQREKKAEIGI